MYLPLLRQIRTQCFQIPCDINISETCSVGMYYTEGLLSACPIDLDVTHVTNGLFHPSITLRPLTLLTPIFIPLHLSMSTFPPYTLSLIPSLFLCISFHIILPISFSFHLFIRHPFILYLPIHFRSFHPIPTHFSPPSSPIPLHLILPLSSPFPYSFPFPFACTTT